MDLTHITKMSDLTESAWQKIKTSKHLKPAAYDQTVGQLVKVVEGDADALFVASRAVCAAGWRHDNLLRPIKRYVAHHPHDHGVHLFREGRRVHSAVFWLPSLQRFIVWLLNSLKGHEADQQRRVRGFVETFSYLSGLRRLRAAEFNFANCKAAWPVELQEDALTWEYKPATQLVLDFCHDELSNLRVDITKLSARCGYSEKHVRRKVKAAAVEFGDTNDLDFLAVADDNTVSRKTAMFLLLSLPRLLRARLLAFNNLYQRLAPPPVPQPAGLPVYLNQTDFNDPAQAVKACLLLVERTCAQQQQHTALLVEKAQQIQDAQGAADVLKAELAGKNEELARLKTSMVQATAAGAFLQSPEVDNLVYHTSRLRQDHGWCTIQDVEAQLLARYGRDNLLAAVHSAMPSGSRDLNTMLRRVIRFEIGQKKLRADGQPVLRPSVTEAGDAYVRRIYVSNASRAGYQANHGTDRTWRWSVFFTSKGVQRIVNTFMTLVDSWMAARCPEYMSECELPGEPT